MAAEDRVAEAEWGEGENMEAIGEKDKVIIEKKEVKTKYKRKITEKEETHKYSKSSSLRVSALL